MDDNSFSRRDFLKLTALGTTALATTGARGQSEGKAAGETLGKPPVVVIGAGLGGLCSAAHLARQGFPVTVVEQHDKPGGYASSFRRGRFNFEVSLHGTALADNAAARMLESLGVSERIELVALPQLYRHVTPELDISVPQKDPEAFVRLLSEHFPDEKEGIAEFVRDLVVIAEAIENLDRLRNAPFELLTSLPYWTLFKIRNKTLADLLDGYVQSPAAREALVALWGYYGLPPSRLSAMFFANATGSYLRDGSYYIRPRSQSLSTALAEVIQAAGGEVRYGTAVERIGIKDGAVDGVVLADGNELPAQVVVSNANAPDTFRRMLPPAVVPPDYREQLAEYRPSISSFIVWLGLKRDATDVVESYNTHVASGRGPEADYRSCLKGEVDRGAFVVTLYDKLYAGYSEPGTSTLQILFLSGYEPWRSFEADYEAGRKDAYHAQKQRWTETLIRRAEEAVVQGLSSMIEVMVSATPLTNRRYTRNPEGAIYGFEQATNNAFFNRIENRTPVDGLYLASAWGFPGGGYVGALTGGKQAAEEIVGDWVD
jgi:prolycopene isomerase